MIKQRKKVLKNSSIFMFLNHEKINNKLFIFLFSSFFFFPSTVHNKLFNFLVVPTENIFTFGKAERELDTLIILQINLQN